VLGVVEVVGAVASPALPCRIRLLKDLIRQRRAEKANNTKGEGLKLIKIEHLLKMLASLIIHDRIFNA
jgi:hypothetical protein